MPPESDHNSQSERVLSAIDSLRTAYYGVETDNPWRADSAKELLESLTTGLDEEDIKSMEGTVNAVLKTRPTTITEKITTRATKDSNDKSEPAKSSLKPSSPTPVEYPSLHDLYNQFQQFKKKMGLDGKTEEEIREDAENLQDQITNVTIEIAELKQKKTKDEKDAAKLKELTLNREKRIIQKKTLNFIVKNPNGMNPVMHLFLDAGQTQTQKELKDWDRQQLPPRFRTLPNFIIRFITTLRVHFSSDFNKTRKDKEKRLVKTTVNLAITELNVEATQDFTVLDAIKDTALAMQTVANTLNTQSVAMTETTPTGSPSTETKKKGVRFNETTTTLNPENESTLTATTKLARAILRYQFTKDDMPNLLKMRSEIYNQELTKLQKRNKTVGTTPTETEKKKADTTTRNLFRDAEQEVQKMITEDNGSRAIACLADTIESRAGEIEKRNSKDAVDKKNPSNSIPRTEAVEKAHQSLCGWAPDQTSTNENNHWSTKYNAIRWSSAFSHEPRDQTEDQAENQTKDQTDPFATFWTQNSSLIYRILKASYDVVYLEAQEELHNARINRLISHFQSMGEDYIDSSNTTTNASTVNQETKTELDQLIKTLQSHQNHDWVTWHHKDIAGLEKYRGNVDAQLQTI